MNRTTRLPIAATRHAVATALALILVAGCGNAETTKKALGANCAAGSDCTTGFCTDQVCCNTGCDGGCERCDYQPNVGSCTAVPSGLDPDNDCADEGATTCGRNGSCNGSRACASYSISYVCMNAVCEGAILRQPRYCDGAGACAPGPHDAGTNCAPYGCDSSMGCFTSCVPDGGATAACASNATCVPENDGGACKGQTNASCASNAQCVSNTCDGGACV